MSEFWDAIEEDVRTNWCQHLTENEDGQHCMLGAVVHALRARSSYELYELGLWPTFDQATHKLAQVICDNYHVEQTLPMEVVVQFNDTHTHDEVLAVVEKARNL